MYGNQNYEMQGTGAQPQWSAQQPAIDNDASAIDADDGDNSRRPPNAFILYSQDMRTPVRQDNPSLSNTEVSRLLGKMWKEVPNETKLKYKQKASELQEEFKRQHPDYTYRKARRKRALNELLTKSSQGYPGMVGGGPYMDMNQMQMMQGNPMMPQIMGQTQFQTPPQQNQMGYQMQGVMQNPMQGFQTNQQQMPQMHQNSNQQVYQYMQK